MNTALKHYQKLNFNEKTIPLALLVAHLLAFGLLLPFLGYYQDDWHFVYYAYTRGAQGLWELFNYDGHPLSAWSYVISFGLLGFKPIYWHIFSLIWRWLASVAFWLLINQLWPKHIRETFTAAILFAVYPLFALQPQAISYVEVWMSYFILNMSFYWMVKAIKNPNRFWWFTALAFLVKVIHLFTTEYFAGLELVRPIIIFLALQNKESKGFKTRLWNTVKVWTPYLIVTGAFTIWRAFFYLSPFAKQNAPILINRLISDPLGTMQYLILSSIPDLVLILTTPWANILSPRLFDFATRANFYFFLIAIFSGITAFIFTERLKKAEPEEADISWRWEAILLGVFALGLSMAPAYAANYFIYTENPPWGSRFSIPAMFGAALVLTALIHAFVSSSRARNIILATLFGLSVGWHLNNTNAFRLVWDKEQKFYEQLTWRAPNIQPNTAIITEQEVLAFMGDYPMGFAINTMYALPNVSTGKTVPYWYFSLMNNFGSKIDDFLRGMPIGDKKFSVRFTGDSTQVLLITFNPEEGECLWLVRPEDSSAPYLTSLMQQASVFSAPYRIIPGAESPFLITILRENPKTWCYYYEKAQLAADQRDWKVVSQNWEKAKQESLTPGNPVEYLVFIEAYANLGDWKSAGDIFKTINLNQKGIRPSLCYLWDKIRAEVPPSQERDQFLLDNSTQLNCGD